MERRKNALYEFKGRLIIIGYGKKGGGFAFY